MAAAATTVLVSQRIVLPLAGRIVGVVAHRVTTIAPVGVPQVATGPIDVGQTSVAARAVVMIGPAVLMTGGRTSALLVRVTGASAPTTVVLRPVPAVDVRVTLAGPHGPPSIGAVVMIVGVAAIGLRLIARAVTTAGIGPRSTVTAVMIVVGAVTDGRSMARVAMTDRHMTVVGAVTVRRVLGTIAQVTGARNVTTAALAPAATARVTIVRVLTAPVTTVSEIGVLTVRAPTTADQVVRTEIAGLMLGMIEDETTVLLTARRGLPHAGTTARHRVASPDTMTRSCPRNSNSRCSTGMLGPDSGR